MSKITEKSIRRKWALYSEPTSPSADFDGSDVGVLLGVIDRLRDINAELLSACKAALSEFDHGMSDIDRLRERLRAAIVKATGTMES